MTGQQQETVAGSTLRRTILALLVAAMMVAMMGATAMPAFAKFHLVSNSQSDCNSGRGNGNEQNVNNDLCDPDNSPRDHTG